MEDSLENWISNLEMGEYDHMFNESYGSMDEQEFLREILQEPEEYFSNPCSTLIQNNTGGAGSVEGGATSPTNSTLSFDETSLCGNETLQKSISSNSIKSLEKCACPPPYTYLLSFDNSITEPITSEPTPKPNSGLGPIKKSVVKDGSELEPRMPQPRKKVRGSTEIQDHILAERKRRQELTGSIIALSATIPGLKKMDKANVLREAVNYTKLLQERVKELENQNKSRRLDSAKLIKKSQASSNKSKSSSNCEKNTESLFEVEARVLEKEVLIVIHCEKQKDVVFKIHFLLQKFHLSITSSSALPFGTSTLIINILAQMDDEYSLSMDELVKNLREYLLEAYHMN